ncbi:hypothetical protein [Staphylococcus phage Stab23]|nr:hypothetical protein [Staphylococcus phage Stab23]
MTNKVYQLEFITEDETRKESKVYSDLLNLIWSLEQEGYKQESSHLLKGYNEEGKEELVVVHTLTHYEGRMMPKEHVYLTEPVYYRFLLFSYESYYPNGGTGDLRISFNTIEELEEDYEYLSFGLGEYIDVFDTKTGRTVNKSDYFPEVVEEVKEYLKNN